MQSTEIWRYIHAERASLVTTLRGLEPEQWQEPSWCEGWSVKQ
ncbi:MAG: maleylpyruvate isomerase N-terminal domain-containing protein, partial [Actinomycetota bacterium]